MTPRTPKYGTSEFYDKKNDLLTEDAPAELKEEYEEYHNGYDWMLFYKELKPEFAVPYKRWNGEIIDIGEYAQKTNEDADDDDGRWVTTKDGNHLFINGEGDPEKGNPYVLAAAKGESQPVTEKKTDKPKLLSKKAMNEDLVRIADSDDDYNTKMEKVIELQRKLPKGSKVLFPDTWDYDDGTKVRGVWDGEKWLVNGGSTKKNGFNFNVEEMADRFIMDDPSERPVITSIAETEEQKKRYAENAEKANWRRKASIWSESGSFSDTMTIKMRKLDLDNCGEGTIVKGPDGREYIKDYDYATSKYAWFDKETYRKADMRTLSNPIFTGDFFSVNFGMNGLSATECENARKMYESLPDGMKSKYEKIFRSTTFEPSPYDSEGNQELSHFDPYSKKVRFSKGTSAGTVFHECAHAFDEGALHVEVEVPNIGHMTINSASQYLDYFGNSRELRTKDFETMAKILDIKTDGNGWFSEEYGDINDIKVQMSIGKNVKKIMDGMFHSFTPESIPGASQVSDAISALTEDRCWLSLYVGGHPTEYWTANSNFRGLGSQRSCEYWANFCQLKASGHDKALEIMKQLTPNMYEAAENAYKEAFKNG